MIGNRIINYVCLLGLAGCEIPGVIVCDSALEGNLAQLQVTSDPGVLSLFPIAATVAVGGKVQFQVTGTAAGSGVEWGVQEKSGGSIWEGDYHAPDQPGVFHVFVENRYFGVDRHSGPCGLAQTGDQVLPKTGFQVARATITVEPPSLAISPSWAEVVTQSTTRFKALSNLVEKGPVNWYLGESSGGRVRSPDEDDLIFTARENTGTFHIRAVLEDHPGIEAYLAVTVATAPGPVTGP